MDEMPTEPPAPERFETTTGTASTSLSFCAMGRVKVSMDPPAGNGTTHVMSRCGQTSVLATAGCAPRQNMPSNAAKKRDMVVPVLCKEGPALRARHQFLFGGVGGAGGVERARGIHQRCTGVQRNGHAQ